MLDGSRPKESILEVYHAALRIALTPVIKRAAKLGFYTLKFESPVGQALLHGPIVVRSVSCSLHTGIWTRLPEFVQHYDRCASVGFTNDSRYDGVMVIVTRLFGTELISNGRSE